MSEPKIAFIGAGNMARAIIGGLIAEGYSRSDISASGPRLSNLEKVAYDFRINVSVDNTATAAKADVVVLAVKPQMLKEVALEIAGALAHKPLIISLAAGITTTSLNQWLGADQAIVRCMPNTPSQLRVGASGLFANPQVNVSQRGAANAILGAVGIVQWVEDESLINAVTAVSGSGPAYFFLMMEAMIDAGVQFGLSRESATELTLQTALGAAMLAKHSDVDVVELRRRVTSPKGTTEQAIHAFEAGKIREIFSNAMQASRNRAIEMSELLGK